MFCFHWLFCFTTWNTISKFVDFVCSQLTWGSFFKLRSSVQNRFSRLKFMDKTMKRSNRQTEDYIHSQISVTKVFQQLQQMLWQNGLYSIKNIPVIIISKGINVEFLFSITWCPSFWNTWTHLQAPCYRCQSCQTGIQSLPVSIISFMVFHSLIPTSSDNSIITNRLIARPLWLALFIH